MTNVIAINGSPRKTWNTATLLERALEGAAEKGASTRLVHLYELGYKGCVSCFACKRRGGSSYGVCALRDELTPLLEDIRTASAIILGSPIYFGNVTGEMRSFLERLQFPYLTYEEPSRTLFPGTLQTAWIYTMNVPEAWITQLGYERMFEDNERLLGRLFGHSQSLMSYDTYQFEDYSKVVATRFDVAEKEKHRQEVFPEDCRRAHELGASLVAPA